MSKGIIMMLEMIAAVIILIISLGVFFPTFTYQNKWNEAILLLKARDFLLTSDRLGLIYNHSYNSTALSSFARNVLDPNLIVFADTQGMIKEEVVIACNCTSDQVSTLNSVFGAAMINDRKIAITFVQTNDLNNIPSSDALLIWGYKPLSDYYTPLVNYINNGNGIVEIMDFRYQGTGNKVDSDIVQTNIFGLKWLDIVKDTVDYIEFERTPTNASDPIYGVYKFFYHFPLPTKPNSTETVSGCSFSPSGRGPFSFNNMNYTFWICNSTSVWFDSDGDGSRDKLVNLNKIFTLSSQNFSLNYIDDNRLIGISFKPPFRFSDFLGYAAPPGEPDPLGKAIGIYRVYSIGPVDDNQNRILLRGVSTSPSREYAVSIVNASFGNRVAWIADMQEEINIMGFTDDKKEIVLSLVLWATNKVSKQPIIGKVKSGYVTPYINSVNKDMLEVYRFNLGLGFPY